jgi:uncharacterized membrane protein
MFFYYPKSVTTGSYRREHTKTTGTCTTGSTSTRQSSACPCERKALISFAALDKYQTHDVYLVQVLFVLYLWGKEAKARGGTHETPTPHQIISMGQGSESARRDS